MIDPISPALHTIFEESQINIAKIWRGYQIRQYFLPHATFLAAKIFLNYCPRVEDLPRAPSGTAPVYFPPDLPVVFKNTNAKKNKSRWHEMVMVRRLCKQKGFTHLKIPLATPYQIWLIEEKVLVTEFKQKGQVGLYTENREKFSTAVTQMTKLLCHLIYPDILTSIHPYQDGCDIPLARYDNLMLFLEDGIGKIGLVDLEHVKLRETRMSKEELFEIALNALLLFPYHTREIYSALSTEFPEIALDIDALERQSDQIVKRYNKIYHDHLASVFHLTPYNPPILPCTIDFTNPVVSLIMEKMLDQIEVCIESILPSTSTIGQLQLRTFSIPIQIILSEHPLCEEILKSILEVLVYWRTIHYANIYLNHAKEPMVRIHY